MSSKLVQHILIGLAALIVGLVIVTDVDLAGASGNSPDLNHPEYWGDDCAKIDNYSAGSSWTSPADYQLVALKSALDHDLFTDVVAGDTLVTPSGKDISHIIYCDGGSGGTTTTVAVTTTTENPCPIADQDITGICGHGCVENNTCPTTTIVTTTTVCESCGTTTTSIPETTTTTVYETTTTTSIPQTTTTAPEITTTSTVPETTTSSSVAETTTTVVTTTTIPELAVTGPSGWEFLAILGGILISVGLIAVLFSNYGYGEER